MYSMAHKSLENNGKIVNVACDVNFAPLCITVCLVAYFPRG